MRVQNVKIAFCDIFPLGYNLKTKQLQLCGCYEKERGCEMKIMFIKNMLCFFHFPAPPDISVEKTWIHASDGCDIELGCTLHGDVNSEVGFIFPSSE